MAVGVNGVSPSPTSIRLIILVAYLYSYCDRSANISKLLNFMPTSASPHHGVFPRHLRQSDARVGILDQPTTGPVQAGR